MGGSNGWRSRVAGAWRGSRFRRWSFRLIAAATAIWGSLAIHPGIGAEPGGRVPRREALARVRQVRQRNAVRLFAIRHVVGTATVLTPDGQLAVKVYARRRGVRGIPKKLDGVPVVVEARGEFLALRWPPIRRAPWHRPPIRRRPGWPRRPPRDRAPRVRIIEPEEGDTVSGEVLVAASAEDDVGVAGVEFAAAGVLIGLDVDGSDGWSAVWDTGQGVDDGSHVLSATATDTAGHSASDSIQVLVDNQPGPFSPDGRPAPIGVSTGNENECVAGTIACRVRDAAGNVYALSNNHIFARLNAAALGEGILQPGLLDTDCRVVYADQRIGSLADFVPLEFRWWGSNSVDAALARTTPADLGTSTPADGYGVPKATPVEAQLDQFVQKYGRSTLLTFGQVSGIDATVDVSYGNRTARFTDQIIVTGPVGFIGPGDSGSLLVTAPDPDAPGEGEAKPVGLLFAGSEDGSLAVANSIQRVLDALAVAIDGQ